MLKKFFLLVLFLFTPFSLFAQNSVEINIDFPYGIDSMFGVTMYEKGVIGPAIKDAEMNFAMAAQITIKNKTDQPLDNLKIDFTLKNSLDLLNSNTDTPNQYSWAIASLKPNESQSIKLSVKRPHQEKLTKNKAALEYSIYKEDSTLLLEGDYSIKIAGPKNDLIPWATLLLGPTALLLLLIFGKYQKLFDTYSTAEIVTAAIFVSFYVAGSIFTQILKTLGTPSIAIHTIWVYYMFMLMLCLVRLVPKKGIVMIFLFSNAVILNTIMWGFNFIHIFTYTIGSAVILELWFYLTGYGRTRFSAIGSGLIFVVYPISFYWFFTAPNLYHHYYSLWYIQLWLSINFFSYLTAGWIGYWFANRIEKVIR